MVEELFAFLLCLALLGPAGTKPNPYEQDDELPDSHGESMMLHSASWQQGDGGHPMRWVLSGLGIKLVTLRGCHIPDSVAAPPSEELGGITLCRIPGNILSIIDKTTPTR